MCYLIVHTSDSDAGDQSCCNLDTCVNDAYAGVTDCFLKWIQCVWPVLYGEINFFLLHDNACPHTAMLVQLFLTWKRFTILYHPPYPDWSHPDYFAFPKLKLDCKVLQFENIESFQRNVTAALKAIPQADFERAMRGLTGHAQWCIHAGGCILNNLNNFFFIVFIRQSWKFVATFCFYTDLLSMYEYCNGTYIYHSVITLKMFNQ